uniref:ADP-sugar pyrophosphatase n=1 Tax=Myxine glutinosa TaxID=7769 RepID=UPI00358ED950
MLTQKGIQRSWESVKRTTRIPQSTIDGVQMIAVLKRTQHDDCLVLVKQFRPPLGCYTLEFPAGLLNSGESVESAALRELQEETGFVAEVTSVSPAALCLEPGICSSADKIVCVLINGDDPANIRPQQQLDDGGMQ